MISTPPTFQIAGIAVVREPLRTYPDDLDYIPMNEILHRWPMPTSLFFVADYKNFEKMLDHCGMEIYHKIEYCYGFPLGGWDCEKSPWKKCVYFHALDPAHDICLYCGHPEERK